MLCRDGRGEVFIADIDQAIRDLSRLRDRLREQCGDDVRLWPRIYPAVIVEREA